MKKLMQIFPALIVAIFGTISLPSTPVHAETLPTLALVNQTFNVTTATQLRFVFEEDSRFVGNTVEIELHRRVASRRSFQSIAQNKARPGVLDALTLPSYQVRRINNSVQFSVPISQGIDTAQSLQIGFDGVYPVTVRIRDAKSRETVAEVLTFINVHRKVDPSKTVQVSTLLRLKTTPSLQPNGSVVLTDETRTRVTQFVELLQSHTYPMTVSVQPEIIEALATSTVDSDKELFVLLREQLRQRSIATAPFVPTDPSMFAAMNMREEFIEQLRVGEDTLNKWLPGVVIQRSTYIAYHYLTTEGIKLLRTAGVVSIILTPRAQQKVSFSRASNVVMKPNGLNSNNVSVIAVDAAVSASLDIDTNTFSSAHAGFRAAAELLVARDDLLASGNSPSSIRLLLSSSSNNARSQEGVAVASTALAGAGGVRFVDMTTPQVATSGSAAVRFSSMTPNTGAARVAGIAAARTELIATASMADLVDVRRELWAHLYAIGVSNTVVNGADYIAGLRNKLSRVRSAVTVTTPNTITLSGRTGAIRIQIRNNSEFPLSVRVRMSSAKLNLKNPIRVVNLAAGGTTEVKVDAGTRSNGRFPLAIRVTTPEGGLEVVPYIQVTARMNAIAGFGQYLSLFLLVLVLLWWWTHWRRTRSERVGGTTVSD
jgi:hypothetical protein